MCMRKCRYRLNDEEDATENAERCGEDAEVLARLKKLAEAT